MSGQSGSETRQLTKLVGVRFTTEEFEWLSGEARAAGITLAEFVRRRTRGQRVVARTDAAAIREVRRQGGIATIALRIPSMREAGREALRAIARAIDHLAGGDVP